MYIFIINHLSMVLFLVTVTNTTENVSEPLGENGLDTFSEVSMTCMLICLQAKHIFSNTREALVLKLVSVFPFFSAPNCGPLF